MIGNDFNQVPTPLSPPLQRLPANGAWSGRKGSQTHLEETERKPQEQDMDLQTPDQPPKWPLCVAADSAKWIAPGAM